MSVRISGVEKNSLIAKKGISPGDELISINDNEINDFLDYRFYLADEKVKICFKKSNGRIKNIKIKKNQYDDIGLDFDNFIMDRERRCANKCIFCFIDQLPKGMRETLYFKDDDTRLSYLFGNYITLTNISEKEIERIINMKITPVNISVHTMNKDLRVKMMGNRNAGKVLDYIGRLADASIEMNTQLVLCPGINDGDELRYSIEQLSRYFPQVKSVAAVPVGLTKFREGLYPLRAYDKESAGEVIDIIESYSVDFKEKFGRRIVYAADEFYLKAGREIPNADFYEDFSQLENGVGLIANLKDEFCTALDNLPESDRVRRVTVITGESAAPVIQDLVDRLSKKCYNFSVDVVPVKNNFFGSEINVTGLVVGSDILSALKGRELGEALIVPKVMLRFEEDLFLDDISIEDLRDTLGVEVITVSNDGYELLGALTGEI